MDKEKKLEVLNIRISRITKEKLKKLARKYEASMAWVVRMLVNRERID